MGILIKEALLSGSLKGRRVEEGGGRGGGDLLDLAFATPRLVPLNYIKGLLSRS